MTLAIAATALGSPSKQDHEPRQKAVRVHHEPSLGAPYLGPHQAPVTIDFFLDLDLRVSRSLIMHTALLELSQRHPRRLRIVYHLTASIRSNTKITEAAMEAYVQGRFFPFLAELARLQGARHDDRLAHLQRMCERAGVRFAGVKKALDEERHLGRLEQNELYRRRRDAGLVPSVLVNGVPMPYARDLLGELETAYRRSYEDAKAHLERGVPLERLYELILREHDRALSEKTPIKVGSVECMLPGERPKVPERPLRVRAPANLKGYSLGLADAPVTLGVFCNFSSRLCNTLKSMTDKLVLAFPEVRVVFYPLAPECASEDEQDALFLFHRAAECANRQGAFPAFYDEAYRRLIPHLQQGIPPRDQIDKLATDLSVSSQSFFLDRQRFDACLSDPAVDELVRSQARAIYDAGIRYVPSIVVGGRIYPGLESESELRSLVIQELGPGLLEELVPTWSVPGSPPGSPQ